MPSLVAHHHFAVMVAQAAEPDLAFACEQSPIAYHWGAQGPDILFYHNAPFGSRTVLLGQRMHREHVASAFTAMIRSAARTRNPTALSYMLGFCTHYCLDRRTHPYIQDTIDHMLMPHYEYDMDACHRLCEADLDAAVIEHYISADQEMFEAFRLLDLQPQASRVAGRILTDVGEQVYRIPTTPAKIDASMRTMRMVFALLHSGSDSARSQIELVERVLGKPGLLTTLMRPRQPLPEDCANLNRRVWHKASVPEVNRRDTFFELFEDSIASALSLQRATYNCYFKATAMNPLFFPADYSGCEPQDIMNW